MEGMAMVTRTTFRASALLVLVAASLLVFAAVPTAFAALDTSPPSTPVKLIFVHHSTGQAWLETSTGLAYQLQQNDYFVSDTNYGWGPDAVGDHTDVGDWWTWFRGTSASTYTTALYAEYGEHSTYARMADPGGVNEVVMFKSCFPNSSVGGSPADTVPAIGSNPLKGNGTSDLTVGNAKGVYLDLLEYFKTQPNKLFVLIVSPPLREVDTNATSAANARYLADWLVDPNGWLRDYPLHNVVAWDYFTVLTGGHHRIVAGAIEHTPGATNYLIYPTGDSHPSAAGHVAAAGEFAPFLNAAYHAWKADAPLTSPLKPVYRFYNLKTGTHFYTADEAEKASVILHMAAMYRYEGIGYSVNTSSTANCVDLYRFYNKRTGTHFYTADANEKNNVVANLSAIYQLDGVAYRVATSPAGDALPVYRFYNLRTGTHFYTVDEAEKNNVINTLGAIYHFEGPGYYLGQ
jgi:Repeat of unknown function (DUF5648)